MSCGGSAYQSAYGGSTGGGGGAATWGGITGTLSAQTDLATALTNIAATNITTGTLALARGGLGASLTDPGADRLLFWDDSAGAFTWLTAGSGLTITDTTISATGSFNPAAPGEIGGTTPAAGTFTSLIATTGAITATGNDVIAGASLKGTNVVIAGGYGTISSGAAGGSDSYISALGTGSSTQFRTAIVQLAQVTTPSSPASNTAQIYSKDVSGTAEMFVMDEAGNETQISPHSHIAPASIIDSAYDDVGYSANYYTGLIFWTNRERETKGKRNARTIETFAEFNARRQTTGDAVLVQRDWNADKAAEVARREVEQQAWATRKAAWEADVKNAGQPFAEIEPKPLTAKPQPAWLTEQLAARAQLITERDAAIAAEPADRTERQQIRATMDALKAGTGTQAERIARIEKALFRLLKDSL